MMLLRNCIKKVVADYQQQHGYIELARRYAYNIANGRFLWRNRVGAEKIEVVVKLLQPSQDQALQWTFNAKDYPLNQATKEDATISDLAQWIAEALSESVHILYWILPLIVSWLKLRKCFRARN